MLFKTAITASICTLGLVSATAQAGETLDRVQHKGELVAVMDQSYPPIFVPQCTKSNGWF